MSEAKSDLAGRLRDGWSDVSDRLPVMEHPLRSRDGTWKTPGGADVTLVTNVGHTRPPEQDGVAFTAYYSAAERRYWVHEGGGISGYDVWYGPFPLAE